MAPQPILARDSGSACPAKNAPSADQLAADAFNRAGRAIAGIHFPDQGMNVIAGGGFCNVQRFPDFSVGQSSADQLEHIAFAGCQRGHRFRG